MHEPPPNLAAEYDQNPDFNDSVDETHGVIRVFEVEFKPSQVLFQMEPESYRIYLADFEPEPTPEEILAIAHELDRQRTQVRREEKELRSQIRIEEVRICRERSQLTRQQADWLRLHPHGSSPNRPVVASPTTPAASPVPDSIPAPNLKPAPDRSPEQSKELERLRSEVQSQRKQLAEQQPAPNQTAGVL